MRPITLLCGVAVLASMVLYREVDSTIIIINNVNKDIAKRMDEMKSANLIQDEKLDVKLGEIKKNVDALKPKEDSQDMKTGKAIGEAIEGLPDIVAGFQTKNYQAVMKGGIKVVTSIVGLFVPGSVMEVAKLVLRALSTIFSLFTGVKTKAPKPPIIAALDQFKVENVQDEIAEIEYLWDMMTKSIAHFEDYLNHKSVITEELASHFYSNSFLKLGIFGKLERMIRDYCITRSHGVSGEDDVENISVCMSLLGAYSRLAVSRGVMLARMAGIVQKAEDHFKELMDKETDSKLKEKFDRKKLNMASYRDNFVYLAGQQRGKDKDVLRFLGDPLNQFQSKRIIFELYSDSHKYPVILNYLLGLDSQFEFLIDNGCAILCPEPKLSGLCRRQPISDKFINWDPVALSATRSWFVPKGLQVSMTDVNSKTYGPFTGMMSYSPQLDANFKSFKVEKMDEKLSDATDNIMICNSEKMCDTIEITKFETHDIKNYHGMDYSATSVLDIPAGVKITLLSAENGKDKINGPILGPFVQKHVDKCGYSEWKSLKVEQSIESEDGRKMIVVCSPGDLFCSQFEPGKTVESDSMGFLNLYRKDGIKCRPLATDDTLDVTIPVGRMITVKKGNAKYGPYTGPAFYPKMNIKEVKIEVEDMWLGDGKGEKRSPIATAPLSSGSLLSKPASGLQFFTAEHHTHHHHKHRYAQQQHQNKTVEIYKRNEEEE